MRFCFLYLLGRGQKLRFLLSKENPLFEKRLSDKLTTFLKRSNLVLTFDRSIFLSSLWPLLPVASCGWEIHQKILFYLWLTYHRWDGHIFIKTILEFQLKQMRPQIKGGKVHYLCQLIIFRWGNYLYVSLFLPDHSSLSLPVHLAPYHRKCALSDYNFWYTCVKLWYLQVFLSIFF